MNVLQQTLLSGIYTLKSLGGAEDVQVTHQDMSIDPLTEIQTVLSSRTVKTLGFVNKPTIEEMRSFGLTQQHEFIYTLMGGPLTDQQFIPQINDTATSLLVGSFKLSKLLFFDSARAVYRFAVERV